MTISFNSMCLKSGSLCYVSHGHIGKLCIHFKNYTVMQRSVGRMNAHDPPTWTYSMTLMDSSKRGKQQVIRWDDLPPHLHLLCWCLSFLQFCCSFPIHSYLVAVFVSWKWLFLFISITVLLLTHLQFLLIVVNLQTRTAPLTSKIAFSIFIQQIQVPNILNMVYTLRFFFLFKMQFVS